MKILFVPLLALGLFLSAESALADRDGYDDRRGHDRGHDRDWRGKGNNGNGWGRREPQRRWNDNRRDTDLSISLNFGRPYNSFGMNSWSSYGSSWYRAPRVITRPRAPVVIYQNTYISNNRAGSVAGPSLLRDVQGRCFEREFDSRGNERRTELPASSCRF